jgi:hypothetical protein
MEPFVQMQARAFFARIAFSLRLFDGFNNNNLELF